jgi:hypothetical protein
MYEKSISHKFTLKHPDDLAPVITIEFRDEKTATAWMPYLAKFDAYLIKLKEKKKQ